nr:sensor histidine kinase [Paenibacillus turpanensis]
MIAFIVVVFIPVMIVGGLLTSAYRQHVLRQATEQTLNNVEKIKSRTEEILRMPIEISSNLMVDKRFGHLVNSDYEHDFDMVKAYWDYDVLKDYVKNYEEIFNIRFYTMNSRLLSNWEVLQPSDVVKQSGWYREAVANKLPMINWHFIPDETKGNQPYLSLVRKIYFMEYRTEGVLVIDVDYEKLHAIVKQEPHNTMIVDDQGYIAAATNEGWVGMHIANTDFAEVLQHRQEGIYDFVYGSEPSKIVIKPLVPEGSRNGLRIVSVFTVEGIVSAADRISRLGFVIMLISMLVAVVLVYFTSSLLTRRLLLLNKVMNKIAMGDLNAGSKVDGNDEIGLLSRQLNHMVDSIRGLMQEVSASHEQQSLLERRQRDITFKMMASQMNPHFLFNALESIRMKAHIQGQQEIAHVVKLLGKLMRRTIEIGSQTITLKEELEMVRYYLEIQHFRYGEGRLRYELEIAEEALDVRLPALIIQPLVENAVIHGLEQVESGGFVRVFIQPVGNLLVVEVSDNGCGMKEEKLAAVLEGLADPENGEGGDSRIGIRNVHQRLVLHFGCDSGLSIRSVPGMGTSVSFQLLLEGGHTLAPL